MEPPSNIAILNPDQNEALDALKLEGSQNVQGGRWHGNFAARVPRSVDRCLRLLPQGYRQSVAAVYGG